MPKPEPSLLDPARYPYSCTIQTRFSDLDTNLHINNAALTGILEDARVRFHGASGFHDAITNGLSTMVASLAVEYLGQSFYPEPLLIHVAALKLGRTSYTLAELVMQQDRIVAYAQLVMVCMRQEGPAEIPEVFRQSVQPWMLRT